MPWLVQRPHSSWQLIAPIRMMPSNSRATSLHYKKKNDYMFLISLKNLPQIISKALHHMSCLKRTGAYSIFALTITFSFKLFSHSLPFLKSLSHTVSCLSTPSLSFTQFPFLTLSPTLKHTHKCTHLLSHIVFLFSTCNNARLQYVTMYALHAY